MAVSIRNFSHQNMVINTPVRFNIKIRGGPEDVRVDGLPDNFYYSWNSSRNRVEVRGTPEKLVFNQQMTVVADDQVRTQTYSVYPLLPIFNQSITEIVVRGIPFNLPVKVDNAPVEVRIEGPWIGLKYRTDVYGFHVYGEIPENANFTKDRFEYSVDISNQAGTVNGTITLTPMALSGINFYILDENKIKVYPVVAPSDTIEQTLTKTKEFNLPAIPGTTANYVSIASDGTNLYLLHSSGPSSDVADLDDQVVVVSPHTKKDSTAGILNRFSITRDSNYYEHDLDDFYYSNGKLYILTSHVTNTLYESYFVLYTIDGSDITRIINLLGRGGGIALTQGYLTAVLFNRNSPNQGNRFTIYPPSWATGLPLIADSHQTYTTSGVIAANFNINTNNVSMTSVNNYAYILSSTLPDRISVAEVLNPVGPPVRRGEISLSPVLTNPKGITIL